MNHMDRDDFFELWRSTCELATGKSPSDGAVEMAFGILSDFQLEEVHDALIKHTNHPDTCDFWPKPGSIRKTIHGGGDLVSQQAWRKVEHAIRCFSYNEDVKFNDPLIMQTIEDLGGWNLFLEIKKDSLQYKENDFKKAYRAYTITGLQKDAPVIFRGKENLERIIAGQEPKSFQSYEERLRISKEVGRELKTTPRPIDALIDGWANEQASADYVLGKMKSLLGMVKIES